MDFADEREIKLARGDSIRITRNSKSADGRRLNSGNVFTIKKISRDGEIVVNTGAKLDPKDGHFTYGCCQTSSLLPNQKCEGRAGRAKC